jgi:thioredoxin 1
MQEAVNDKTFTQEVLANELPVFVDFWAQWCPPCHRLAPVLDELAVEWAGRIRFVTMDVDENPETAKLYRILSMPTLSIFHGGELVSQTVGAQPRSRLRAQLDGVLRVNA